MRLRAASEPAGGAARADGSGNEHGRTSTARRRLLALVFVLPFLAVFLGTGAGVLGSALASGGDTAAKRVDAELPAVPLGAGAAVGGGIARISGVLPLQDDNWAPTEPAPELEGPALAGFHRVRVVVELTAQDLAGLAFDSSEYVLEDWAGARWMPLWAAPSLDHLGQGEIQSATLVFEVPNEAGGLILEAPGGTRLTVRTAHGH